MEDKIEILKKEINKLQNKLQKLQKLQKLYILKKMEKELKRLKHWKYKKLPNGNYLFFKYGVFKKLHSTELNEYDKKDFLAHKQACIETCKMYYNKNKGM